MATLGSSGLLGGAMGNPYLDAQRQYEEHLRYAQREAEMRAHMQTARYSELPPDVVHDGRTENPVLLLLDKPV